MSSAINNTANSTATSTASATASCISVTPDKNGYVPEWACNANYNFYPSFGGAMFFAIFFGIFLILHISQAFTYKKWKLCWVIVMGVAWEFASFCARALGAKHQQAYAPAFISQILFLLAPMWINAFIYMVLGRMIYFFVPEQKVGGIEGIQIAKIFVCLDVVSFLTQVGGGVLIQPGGSPGVLMTGIHIYMGGIAFQEFCILIFTSIAIKMALTLTALERETMDSHGVQTLDGHPPNWRTLFYILMVSLALITTRIIFRLVEFAAGLDPAKNPIPFHEVYVFVLDATPMLLAVALLCIVHPGRVLRGVNSEFPKGLSRKEKKDAKRAKKAEKKARQEEKKALKNGVKLQSINYV